MCNTFAGVPANTLTYNKRIKAYPPPAAAL
jgi:hypothetical protein